MAKSPKKNVDELLAKGLINAHTAHVVELEKADETSKIKPDVDKLMVAVNGQLEAFGDDAVVMLFTHFRDMKARLNSLATRRENELKEQMEALGHELLRRMMKRKNDGFKTAYGTVYKEEDFKPSAADWNTIYEWIEEDNSRFELLEKRLKKDFVKTFMKEHATTDDHGKVVLGSPPPGVSVLREFVARVRKV